MSYTYPILSLWEHRKLFRGLYEQVQTCTDDVNIWIIFQRV